MLRLSTVILKPVFIVIEPVVYPFSVDEKGLSITKQLVSLRDELED